MGQKQASRNSTPCLASARQARTFLDATVGKESTFQLRKRTPVGLLLKAVRPGARAAPLRRPRAYPRSPLTRRPDWPNSLRTAAVELPTLLATVCSSSFETPSSWVQKSTPKPHSYLILLRSSAPFFFRSFIVSSHEKHHPSLRTVRGRPRPCRPSFREKTSAR